MCNQAHAKLKCCLMQAQLFHFDAPLQCHKGIFEAFLAVNS